MTDEVAQLAALDQRLKIGLCGGSRERESEYELAYKTLKTLAERLLQERDQWKMFHDSLTESGAVVVNELQRETGRANRAEQERDVARAEHVQEHEQTRAFWINRHGMQVERAEAAEARVRALEDAARGLLAVLATTNLNNAATRALFTAKDRLHDALSERVLDGGGQR